MKKLLILVLLLFASQVAFADTETLRPNAAGSTTEWTAYPANNNYTRVDEASTNDADYVYATGSKIDLYNLAASAIHSYDTIVSVTLWIRAKCPDPGMGAGLLIPLLRPGSTNRIGAEITPTTSYANYSTVWTTNPDNSQAWTAADLANLQAGMDFEDLETEYVSQLWVDVDYNPGAPSGPPAGVRGYQGGVVFWATNSYVQVRGKQ